MSYMGDFLKYLENYQFFIQQPFTFFFVQKTSSFGLKTLLIRINFCHVRCALNLKGGAFDFLQGRYRVYIKIMACLKKILLIYIILTKMSTKFLCAKIMFLHSQFCPLLVHIIKPTSRKRLVYYNFSSSKRCQQAKKVDQILK